MKHNFTFLNNPNCVPYIHFSRNTSILLQPQCLRERFHHLSVCERVDKKISCIRRFPMWFFFWVLHSISTSRWFFFLGFVASKKMKKNNENIIITDKNTTNLPQTPIFTTSCQHLKMKKNISHPPLYLEGYYWN